MWHRRRSPTSSPGISWHNDAVTPQPSFTQAELDLIKDASPYTMTSPERLVANMDAVAHVIRRNIQGALVECGVWRGGSVLVMIRTLQSLGITDRDVYLFDTFDGMTRPTEADTSAFTPPALETWHESADAGRKPWEWVFGQEIFNLHDVRQMLHATGYPPDRIHLVEGRVEDTIPPQAPTSIAVLRLDTDWYESTAHELAHLYPRLASGGVLIVDDYGHWDGARRAVDEYFASDGEPILLTRIDYTGRMGVKV
jgi:hypothetical protein